MTQPLNTRTPAIEDALYELSLERRIPNAELLDDIVRRYPEYATELTNFVIELVLDRFHDIVMEPEKANSDTDDLGISLVSITSVEPFSEPPVHRKENH